jgi:cytochrome c biogenesis protein CcmG/thiol:disulfide interchange protein DsbE
MTEENPVPLEQISGSKTRPNLGRIFVWGVLAILLAIVGMALFRNQQGPVQIGKAAPDFSLTTFDGDQIDMADLRGKVVVLNFWASWCKPCEQEAADLEEAWRNYQPRGDVIFLGIDWTDTEPKAMQYLKKFNISYPNGPDLGTRISQAYRTTGVPETYIIDQQGILRFIKLSPFLSTQEIYSVIDPLLTTP